MISYGALQERGHILLSKFAIVKSQRGQFLIMSKCAKGAH